MLLNDIKSRKKQIVHEADNFLYLFVIFVHLQLLYVNTISFGQAEYTKLT